jgi:hypothetical protein
LMKGHGQSRCAIWETPSGVTITAL